MRGIEINIFTRWGILSFMVDPTLSRDTCGWSCFWIFHIEWFSNA